MYICHYCEKIDGRRTELSEAWVRTQALGFPLACNNHLLQQQLDIQASRERQAKRNRNRT